MVIGTEPRLKATPFVFGGNMVIHRNLFTVVPFDQNVRRGEDIDFLINARMLGFHFSGIINFPSSLEEKIEQACKLLSEPYQNLTLFKGCANCKNSGRN